MRVPLRDLKTEIETDPTGRSLSWSMSDVDLAAALNLENIPHAGVVSSTGLKKWAAAGPRAKLETGSLSGDAAQASACLTAIDMLGDGVTTFDTSDANNLALLNVLVPDVLSEPDRDSLIAAGLTNISRAQQLGWPKVKVGHVQAARSL